MIKWARPASLVARAVRLATNEATALGLTGVAPFRDIAVDPYIVDRWPEPIPVSLDSPVNVAGPGIWTDDRPAELRYHYTAVVENGTVFANGAISPAQPTRSSTRKGGGANWHPGEPRLPPIARCRASLITISRF